MADHEAERQRLLGVAWADVQEARAERDQLAAEVRRLDAIEQRAQAILDAGIEYDPAWRRAARHILGGTEVGS